MALHAKVLKHNILRVSKLRKLSHTTQAIENNFEKNGASLCRAEQEETTACSSINGNERLQTEVSTQGVLHTSSPRCSSLDLAELLLSYQQPCASLRHLAPQHKALMPLPLSGIESLLLSNHTDNIPAVFHPLEGLSSVVKPVSYSADDIFIRSSDVSLECAPVLPGERGIWRTVKATACEDPTCDKTNSVRTQLSDDGTLATGSFVTVQGHSTSMDSSVQVSVCDGIVGHGENTPADTHTVMFSTGKREPAVQRDPNSDPKGSEKGPNLDQLRVVESFFIETLPHLFRSRMDYSVYHPDVVFENNFWGKEEVFVGINKYATQMMKFRALNHLKYAHVHMEVISSACLLEEGVVRIQWRIVGLSQLKALKFWKYTAWSYGKSFREDAEWIDGVSILHVNKDGLVIKHRMDRMMPDEEQMVRKSPSLAARLAVLTGLSAPKPGLTDFSSFFCRRNMLAQKLT